MVKSEEMDQLRNKAIYKDVCMVVEKLGIEGCDEPEPFRGTKKQMMKLCNYWVFYNNLVCDGILQEPTQN